METLSSSGSLSSADRSTAVDILEDLLAIDETFSVDDFPGVSSLLLHGCMYGDFELATLLLEAKANPIGVCTEDGDGLMLLVTNAMVQGDCQKSGFNVLQCLLDHDCDIDEQNSDGHCALLCACAAGNMEVIQFLLDNGASASVVNKCGHSAMDVAEGFGYTEVGAMLQKAAVAAA